MRTISRFLLPLMVLTWSLPAAAQGTDVRALDEEALLEDIKQSDPSLYGELMKVKAESEVQYQSRLMRARGRVELRHQHPEWAEAEARLAEVEAQVDQKVAAHHAADTDEGRQTLEAELQELAETVHDLRLDSYRFRIALLRMRLTNLEQKVKVREENRDGFIEAWLGKKLAQ